LSRQPGRPADGHRAFFLPCFFPGCVGYPQENFAFILPSDTVHFSFSLSRNCFSPLSLYSSLFFNPVVHFRPDPKSSLIFCSPLLSSLFFFSPFLLTTTQFPRQFSPYDGLVQIPLKLLLVLPLDPFPFFSLYGSQYFAAMSPLPSLPPRQTVVQHMIEFFPPFPATFTTTNPPPAIVFRPLS